MEDEVKRNFIKLISNLIDISEEHIDIPVHLFQKITYEKNDYFSTPENQSTYLAFIEKGLFRQFLIDDQGNEFIRDFRGENMLMSTYAGIIRNQFHPLYIQALENSTIYAIERNDFVKFWEKDNLWKNLLQNQTEIDFIRLRKREFGLLLHDAKTRYLHFLNDFSQYADRIKNCYVASYLGITSETLSRIRSSSISSLKEN